jgi:integrase
MENHWIPDWISKLESEATHRTYLRAIGIFSQFCQVQGASFSSVVEDWREARDRGRRAEQRFQDRWNDLIRGYTTYLKIRYVPKRGARLTPLTQRFFLTVVKSFFQEYKILVDVDLPRRACVQYHNQDFSKEQIRMILAKASQRDRAIFLMMAESGLRGGTVVSLKYWQIRDDLEKDRIPLRILTPSSTLKDHVGDRWSFIGDDGAKALREYLKPRLPLRAEDYVFASGKPSRVKGEQFTEASISTIFKRITDHLKMEKGSPIGKPGHYRLHGLRKFFFNNMMAPKEFRDFWMGHTISGSDEHYITRDPEKHRTIYAQGYQQLRILEQGLETGALANVTAQLKTRDEEIKSLKESVSKMQVQIEMMMQGIMKRDREYFEEKYPVLRRRRKSPKKAN